MDRTERFYKIENLLGTHRVVSRDTFLEKLEISYPTFKRDLEYMRERLHVPIEYNRDMGGYCFGEGYEGSELPGLWFNSSEIHALLTMDYLLTTLQPGLLGPHIEPFRARIATILNSKDQSVDEIRNRIKLVNTGYRPVKPENFEQIAHALLKRVQITINHHNRGRGDVTQRTVSPQRLTYYKGTWYLDAWCHMRKGIRRFGMDAVELCAVEVAKAKEVPATRLKKELDSGYGIFGGNEVNMAEMEFTKIRSQWACNEIWHEEQVGNWSPDGTYHLKVPYTNENEMASEVLHYGDDVKVLGPKSLIEAVTKKAMEITKLYK